MTEFLTWLVKWLIPPMDHPDDKQYGWRVRVAIVSLTSFVGMIAIAIALAGFFPRIEFARAADVKQQISAVQAQVADVQQKMDSNALAVQRALAADQAERIEGELLQLRMQHCKAKSTAKDLYWDRISKLMVRYQQLTGRVYPLAQCADL